MAKTQQYKEIKNPADEIDYGRNWGTSLCGDPGVLDEDEKIVISTWIITADKEVTPTLVISAQGTGISSDGKMTSVFLEGGTSGVAYKLTNAVTTYDGTNNRDMRVTGIIICCTK